MTFSLRKKKAEKTTEQDELLTKKEAAGDDKVEKKPAGDEKKEKKPDVDEKAETTVNPNPVVRPIKHLIRGLAPKWDAWQYFGDGNSSMLFFVLLNFNIVFFFFYLFILRYPHFILFFLSTLRIEQFAQLDRTACQALSSVQTFPVVRCFWSHGSCFHFQLD